MGNHAIHIHVTGGTDAIRKAANKAVAELKKVGTVSTATLTHGATQVLDGLGEALGEAEFGGSR